MVHAQLERVFETCVVRKGRYSRLWDLGLYVFAGLAGNTTVLMRTDKACGCLSGDTILTLALRLGMSAEQRWIGL